MANKTFNVRIASRYDSYEAWTQANPVLLKGEVAVVTVGEKKTDAHGNIVQVPCNMIKVGDNTTAFNDLPWLSGLSADVANWAKAENKPTYFADEITGLADYINGEVQDTDTQYRLTTNDNLTYKLQSTKTPGDEASWTDVPNGAFKVTKVEAGTAAGNIKIDGVDVPITGFSTLSDKVTANENAIKTLNGDAETAGSVAKAVKDADDALRTELTNTMNAKISSTYKPAGSLASAGLTADLLTKANEGKVYNMTDALTTTDNFVEGAGKTYPAGTNVVIIPTGTEETPVYKFDVLAGFVDLSGYSTTEQMNTAIDTALDNPANLPENIPTSKIENFDTNVTNVVNGAIGTEGSDIRNTVKGIADASATAAVQGLDVEDTIVNGQVVTGVSETDGKITVTRNTVDIAHLTQAADGDTIIFNCGGAGAPATPTV